MPSAVQRSSHAVLSSTIGTRRRTCRRAKYEVLNKSNSLVAFYATRPPGSSRIASPLFMAANVTLVFAKSTRAHDRLSQNCDLRGGELPRGLPLRLQYAHPEFYTYRRSWSACLQRGHWVAGKVLNEIALSHLFRRVETSLTSKLHSSETGDRRRHGEGADLQESGLWQAVRCEVGGRSTTISRCRIP
jgi:hypothetical protein